MGTCLTYSQTLAADPELNNHEISRPCFAEWELNVKNFPSFCSPWHSSLIPKPELGAVFAERASSDERINPLVQNEKSGVGEMWGRPLCLTENCRHWTAGTKQKKPRGSRCQEYQKWVLKKKTRQEHGTLKWDWLEGLYLSQEKKNETMLSWALKLPTHKFTVVFFLVNHESLFQILETQSLY